MRTEDDARRLRRERQGKKMWEENPLVTLGLSPAILDLGLSQDDLYPTFRMEALILLNFYR